MKTVHQKCTIWVISSPAGLGVLVSSHPFPPAGVTQWANSTSWTTQGHSSVSFPLLDALLHLPHHFCRGHPGGHCAADLKLDCRAPTLGAPTGAGTPSLYSGSFCGCEVPLGSARGFGQPEPRSGAPLENCQLPLLAVSRGKRKRTKHIPEGESKIRGRKEKKEGLGRAGVQ